MEESDYVNIETNGKAFGKIQHPSMTKTLSSLEEKESLLNQERAYMKHTANTLHRGQILNTFPLRFGTRHSYSIFYCRSYE